MVRGKNEDGVLGKVVLLQIAPELSKQRIRVGDLPQIGPVGVLFFEG